MRIAVCLKCVDLRPEVDPLTGVLNHDGRSYGASDADQAALEWALRCADAWDGEVVAVSAGPPAAERVLRDAVAAGAANAVHVRDASDMPTEAAAAAVAPTLAGADIVWCGDVSADRGSGAFPAYIAARLGTAQALGLVGVELGSAGTLEAVRRLDGGRRERLRITGPAVCSVEGSTARLRRASLAAAQAARTFAITRIDVDATGPTQTISTVRPFRPRARVLPAPHGQSAHDRIVALTAGHASAAAGQPVTLEPREAAARILDALAEWGELDEPAATATATVAADVLPR